MSQVAETGEIIVITKNGRPVAQLGPVVSRATTLAGAHRGRITIRGDIVAQVDEAWEAACSSSTIIAGPRPSLPLTKGEI